MNYLMAFLVGGIICLIGQILIIRTKITSARILVIFLIFGVILGIFNIYEPLQKFCGAGIAPALYNVCDWRC